MRISDWSSDVCSSDLVDNRSTVDYWLPQVREPRIRDTIAHLSSYQNRYYASPAGKASAEWIRDSWAALAAGRSDVTTELFTACATCSTQPSRSDERRVGNERVSTFRSRVARLP